MAEETITERFNRLQRRTDEIKQQRATIQGQIQTHETRLKELGINPEEAEQELEKLRAEHSTLKASITAKLDEIEKQLDGTMV